MLKGTALLVGGLAIYLAQKSLLGAAFLLAMAVPTYLLGRRARQSARQVPFGEIVALHAHCRMITRRAGKHSYKEYWVGPFKVIMGRAWLAFWPEGETVEVEICPLVSTSGASSDAIVISLPGITVTAAERAGKAPTQRGGWLFAAMFCLAALVPALVVVTDHSPRELRAGLRSLGGPVPVPSVGALLADPELVGAEVRIQKAVLLSTPDRTHLVDLSDTELGTLEELLARKPDAPAPTAAELDRYIVEHPCPEHPLRARYRDERNPEIRDMVEQTVYEYCRKKSRVRLTRELGSEASERLTQERARQVAALLARKGARHVPLAQHQFETEGVERVQDARGVLDDAGHWTPQGHNHAVRSYGLFVVLLLGAALTSVLAYQSGRRYQRALDAWVMRVRGPGLLERVRDAG